MNDRRLYRLIYGSQCCFESVGSEALRARGRTGSPGVARRRFHQTARRLSDPPSGQCVTAVLSDHRGLDPCPRLICARDDEDADECARTTIDWRPGRWRYVESQPAEAIAMVSAGGRGSWLCPAASAEAGELLAPELRGPSHHKNWTIYHKTFRMLL